MRCHTNQKAMLSLSSMHETTKMAPLQLYLSHVALHTRDFETQLTFCVFLCYDTMQITNRYCHIVCARDLKDKKNHMTHITRCLGQR